jgi:3-hydroxyacyl-CoA dehydrogenase
MGAQIAAHLANAGLPVLLLDLTAEAAARGLDRLRVLRPDPCFVPEVTRLIRTGSFDDMALLSSAGVDWVIEAITEQLDIKRQLLARVEAHARPDAILSSNTSGIPLSAIAEGRSPEFRRRWLGTHFFNPPRYLRLVELIPTADTDAEVLARVADFIDHRLGKGVVVSRDTPGFIANRIGIFGAVRLLEAVASGEFTIEEIDALTGALIGRPKSATFRTLDMAGLDILSAVAGDLARRLGDEGRAFELPAFVKTMVERGLVGVKTGHGFYQRVKTGDDSKIVTLDLATFEYREASAAKLPGLEAMRAIGGTGPRIRALLLSKDRAGDLLRRTLGATLVYAAAIAPEIAQSIDDVDRAMRWGFGWELGPFETWDAIGIRAVLDACHVTAPPPVVAQALASGRDRFRDGDVGPAAPGLLILQTAKSRAPVVKTNAGASLVDLGDGVLAVEFHSKMNAIGGDTLEMVLAGIAEAAANHAALVIGCEADVFSAGANLMLLLLEAQEGNWDEVDLMVRAFQKTTMAIKTAPIPVIVAPAGLALGGGCEICLHADRVQAAAETYMGLVEVGVGLIPAGGGTKEMLLRAVDLAGGRDTRAGVQAVFETIGFGKVSTSGADARRLGYLRDVDAVTMNRERVMADAKARALARVQEGYQPPQRRAAVPVGGADVFAMLSLGVHLAQRAGRISDHDALIGRKIARILSGGDLPHASHVTEEDLLGLEREAFLSLCGEPKTQARVGYTLKTGKTLRN